MRTVVAVDWSEQSFNAAKVVCRLFTHEALTLIHAVDLRPFENPLLARPDWRVELVDTSHKKVAFLTQAAIELALRNVAAHATRVATVARRPAEPAVVPQRPGHAPQL